MNKFFKIAAVVLLVLTCSNYTYSQNVAACNAPQNICTNPSFTFNASVNNGLTPGLNISNPSTNPQMGNGASATAPANSGCLLTSGPGPQWLMLTVSSTGNLGFVFGAAGSAFPQVGLYDWAMWAYNPNTCNDIFNNIQAPVSCNWNCSSIGGTGMGPPPPAVAGATPSPCNFQPSIPVVAGQQFLILLSNFSAVTTTVSIANNGTAGLTCSPLVFPSVYSCPNQPAVSTGTWSNFTNTSFTLMPGNVVQTNPSFTVSAPATQIYTVFAQGLDSANALISATTTFSLLVAPNTPITVSSSGTVCQNSTGTLTASLPTATAYAWSGPGGFTSTASSVTITNLQLVNSGIYTVTSANTMPTPNPVVSCPVTATVDLTVVPVNQVTATPGFTQCQGSNVNLVSSATAANSYSWNGPGFTSGLQNPVLTGVLPQAAGVYTVTAYFTIGTLNCTSQAASIVSVVATPPVNMFQPFNACQFSNANISANAPGALSYNWTGPASFTSNAQSPLLSNIQPANAGVYNVTAFFGVAGTQTCSSTGSSQMSVTPVNQVNTTPSFTQCEGANINLTAAATAANSYSWVGPAFTSTLQNPTLSNVVPASAGIYSVTAYFTTGTLVCTSQNVTTVSVVATPPVIMFTPFDVCQNTNANLSANATGAGSYSWTGPAGFTSTVQTPVVPNVQPTHSGLYYSTAFFSLGTKTCSSVGSSQINVITVNPVVVTPTINVCQPNSTVLQANASQAISYSWAGPNSFTAGPSGSVPLFYPTLSATGVYTVTASFTGGTITCRNSNTLQLNVNPTLGFTIDAYKQVCYGDSLQITGPAGATSYTWYGGNGGYNINTKDLLIPSAQPSNSAVYTLSVSLGDCVSGRQVLVDVLEPISFSLTPESRVVCRGDEIQLLVGAAGGSENFAYNWSPQQYLSALTGSILTAKPLGTTIYNVQAYDILCPLHTITYPFTIQVNQPPLPDLRLDKTEGCEPLCLFFNTRTKGVSAITTYDFGGFEQMQQDSFMYCLTEPGSYTLKIQTRGKNGCNGLYEHPVPLVVYPRPHSSISWNPPVPTTTENQVRFSPSFKYGPVVSHDWMFTGTGVSGYDTTDILNPERVFENVGKYPVMLISQTDKGCVDTVVKILEIRDEFAVYIPNSFTPNADGINDIFNIKGIGLKLEGFSMDLFDRWGKLVYSTTDITKGWDGSVKGQLSPDGVYIYKIRVVGANGEGRKEYTGHVTLIK